LTFLFQIRGGKKNHQFTVDPLLTAQTVSAKFADSEPSNSTTFSSNAEYPHAHEIFGVAVLVANHGWDA